MSIHNTLKLTTCVIALITPLTAKLEPVFSGPDLQDMLNQSSTNRALFNRYFAQHKFKSSGRLLNIFGLSLLNVYSANIVSPHGEINCTPTVGPEMEHMEYLYDVYKPGEPALVQGIINGVAFGTLMLTPCQVWKIPSVSELTLDAERGDPEAQFQLGETYTYGVGLPIDLKLGAEWYQRAAKQGHSQATVALKLLSERKELSVYKAEQDLAINQMRQEKTRIAAYAAANVDQLYKTVNDGDSEAQMNLGRRYLQGDGVTKDEHLGIEYLYKAAAQGNIRAFDLLQETATPGIIFNGNAEAAFALGRLYAEGEGIATNDEKALQWFRLAKTYGYAEAEDTVKIYDSKVLEKIHKAISKNDPKAYLELATRYLEPPDTETKPNPAKAIPLLIKATGLGLNEALQLLKKQANPHWLDSWFNNETNKVNPDAAFAVGEIYFRGINTAINLEEAAYWYELAATNGIVEAKNKLLEIKKLESKK